MNITTLLALFLIGGVAYGLSIVPLVSAYEIDGDHVIEENDDVYLETFPHTFTMPNQTVTHCLVAKQYTGQIDVAFGFDTDDVVPSGAMYNGKDISGMFDKTVRDYMGMDTWHYIKNVSVEAGETYCIDVRMNVLRPSSGKYFMCIKPSSQTISQAVAAGNFYCSDPWYSVSYLHKYQINASTTSGNVTLPILVNDTGVFFPGGSTTQYIWCNYTVNTTTMPIGYLYYNDETDYVCVDSDETGTVPTSAEGNGSSTGLFDGDLILWLHMNGTDGFDSSRYGRALSALVGSPIANSSSYLGTGLEFRDGGTGTDEGLDYGDINALDGLSALSICAWFKGFDQGTIVSKFDGSASSGFAFLHEPNNKRITWAIHDGDWEALSVDRDIFDTNIWIHACGTYDSETLRLYVNGVLNGTDASPSGAVTANAIKVAVGYNDAGAEGYYDYMGIIDEVYIYNRTLSADEVMAMYNNTVGGHSFSVLSASELYPGPAITLDSPANTTYIRNFTLPLTFQYTHGDNLACNASVYSISGSANVSTACSNSSLTVDPDDTYITLCVNDSVGILNCETTYFSIISGNYTLNLYDEMTLLAYNESNMTITSFCSNDTEEYTITSHSSTLTLDCEFDEVKITIGDSAGNSHWRTLKPDYYQGHLNFYLINMSEDTYTRQAWSIYDVTGDYDGGYIRIMKVITDLGSTDVIEQDINAEGNVVLYLIVDEEYIMHVVSEDGGTTRNVGGVLGDTTTEKTLTVSVVPFDPALTLVMSNVFYSVTQNASGQYIRFYYNDTLGLTNSVTVTVLNASNISQTMYTDTSTASTAIFTYNGVNINSTYIAKFEISHQTFGSIEETKIVEFGSETSMHILGLSNLGLLKWEAVFGVMIVIVTILMFGSRNAPVGFGIGAIEMLMFWNWGWFNNMQGWEIWGLGLIVLMFFVAAVAIIEKGRPG